MGFGVASPAGCDAGGSEGEASLIDLMDPEALSWNRANCLEISEKLHSDEVIEFHIVLPDAGFDLTQLASADGAEHDRLIAARKESLVPFQEEAEALVEQLGGTVLGRTWLVPGLIVEAPAGLLPSFVERPEFLDISCSDPDEQVGPG